MKNLLLIAYHFPPLAGSSGVQRSLQLVRQLPQHGWQPAVLTAHPRTYTQVSDDLGRDLPAPLEVVRAFALDASRHLSILGRYPGFLARPDRYLSWLLGAVPAGLAMIRRLHPAAIWSTYPIPTAHLIGYWLSRLSGLPWIADFRDPMAHEGYPEDPATWQSYLRTEQKVFARAQRLVFTTPGAAKLYRQRYPERAADVHVIENGYDEASFARAESTASVQPLNPGAFTLLHSGIVYPSWRNPSALFQAMQQLRAAGAPGIDRLRVRFRAPVHDAWLAELARTHGVSEQVEILPALPYREALAEMLAADALLALQSQDCNDQIPAKVYEYLRAARPILGLTDPAGDTGSLLRRAGMGPVVALESSSDATQALAALLLAPAAQTANPTLVRGASREARTQELAALLNGLHTEPLSLRPHTE